LDDKRIFFLLAIKLNHTKKNKKFIFLFHNPKLITYFAASILT